MQLLDDDGARETFGARVQASTGVGGGLGVRPAICTLWAGARECVVHSITVQLHGQPPFSLAGALLRCWAFSPPSGYRFLFGANSRQLVGPGFGTALNSAIDDQIRQSQAIVVAGYPWIAADDPPTPPLFGEGASGHPVVQTASGPAVLRGPEVLMHDVVGSVGAGPERTRELLLPGMSLHLRRYDPLCVITEAPTLGGGAVLPLLVVSFWWSELSVPAYEPNRFREGFAGAL